MHTFSYSPGSFRTLFLYRFLCRQLSWRLVPLILTASFCFSACTSRKPVFESIPSSSSGIHFNNDIKDDARFNVMSYEYIYNGGGVGIGDFNNDSLPDIYFTGSMVSNKLYLNKGNLQFRDVTDTAGVGGNGKWCKGVTVVDINNDGWQDIYVSAAVLDKPEERRNLLYINKGVDPATGIPTFVDEAAAYGLADETSTHMAAFFDYDNDGDLDVYLLENDVFGINPNEFRPIRKDGSWPNTDKLFRNDWDPVLKHPVFTDVSKAAGITVEGYGLGVNITDINNDGWKDIYVSNDFISNNLLYINNGNGTFTEQCASYLKHTSRNAMGNEVADINNDGLQDIIEVDMAPADNYRLKMMNSPISYQNFQTAAYFGYMQQYVHNTLQLNQGPRLLENDSVGAPVFSEVAYYSGIAHTDWSWAPLAVDIDNDGYRDLMISNGLPKDLSDQDFIAYRNAAIANVGPEQVLKQLPTVKISNYIYRNNGDITFTDKTKEWGWDEPGFSAGMAYADFDRDGDVDVVVNNTMMEAFLLKNTLNDQKKPENNYLRIQLQGDSNNKQALGATLRIYYQGKQQLYEFTPYRGYLSSVEAVAHFGLGTATTIDSLLIIWPDNKRQLIKGISANQTMTVKYDPTNFSGSFNGMHYHVNSLFKEFTKATGLYFGSLEDEFIDFNVQRMLPHKFSQYGPALAAGDLNGDGLDDLVGGGGAPSYAKIYLQTASGQFQQQTFLDSTKMKLQDDAGICLFDADGDGDLDIYIASGGSENAPKTIYYTDHLYINDGKANFHWDSAALSPNMNSKSCVKAADFDQDGDLDLFIGGRVIPSQYPKSLSSFILRNDTKNGVVRFTDVSKEVAPALENIGMVTDASWTDIDNNGTLDLVLVGEWQAPMVFKNEKGKLSLINTELSSETGWWTSITMSDIDNDGDMDIVAGNYGLNGYLRPTTEFPVKVYGKDFDNNRSFDAILTSFVPAKINEKKTECPVFGREDFIREMNGMREKFPNYSSYAGISMDKIFTSEELKEAVIKSAVQFQSCWFENKGDFHFALHPLPVQAQWAPLYGMLINDYDGDGNMDMLINGNEFSMAPMFGRYDAMNGLYLKGDGKGGFKPLSILESGIYMPGNGKALMEMVIKGERAVVSSRNAGPSQLFRLRARDSLFVRGNPDDQYAIITLKDGHKRKVEFGYGSSFYSQSSRYLFWNSSFAAVEIVNGKGQKRAITPHGS